MSSGPGAEVPARSTRRASARAERGALAASSAAPGSSHDDLLAELRVLVGRSHARQELAERVDGRGAGRPLVEPPLQLVENAALLAEQDVFLALEVGEDRPRRDVRRLGDLGERRLVVAALGEQPQRRAGDRLARLLLLAFPQSRLRRRACRASSYLAAAYHQIFTSGNFAMSVDFPLHSVYKCIACKLATHESRSRYGEHRSLDNGAPTDRRDRLDRRRDRDPRDLELGRKEDREQLHAPGHGLAAGRRPAAEPLSRPGRGRRPDRVPRQDRQADRRGRSRGDRRDADARRAPPARHERRQPVRRRASTRSRATGRSPSRP